MTALLVCELLALALVFRAGYHWLPLLLTTVVLATFTKLLRDQTRGLQLRWREGEWALGRESPLVIVELLPMSRSLPWGVYLAWRESTGGRRGKCWVYADSLSAGELRRLRCRLTLQG